MEKHLTSNKKQTSNRLALKDIEPNHSEKLMEPTTWPNDCLASDEFYGS